MQQKSMLSVVLASHRAENEMAKEIAIAGIDGSLALNDDGELVYTKSGLQAEVLKPEQAIERWPAAEKQIRAALSALD